MRSDTLYPLRTPPQLFAPPTPLNDRPSVLLSLAPFPAIVVFIPTMLNLLLIGLKVFRRPSRQHRMIGALLIHVLIRLPISRRIVVAARLARMMARLGPLLVPYRPVRPLVRSAVAPLIVVSIPRL